MSTIIVIPGASANTQQDIIPFQGGGVGVAPWGKVVHRGNAAIGATNDVIQLDLPLPTNNAWQLHSCSLACSDGAGVSGFASGHFEMTYQPSYESYGAGTELWFPIAALLTLDSKRFFKLGEGQAVNSGNGAIETAVEFPDLYKLISFHGDFLSGSNPTLTLNAPVAAGATTFDFSLEWMGYTYDQMSSGILHI